MATDTHTINSLSQPEPLPAQLLFELCDKAGTHLANLSNALECLKALIPQPDEANSSLAGLAQMMIDHVDFVYADMKRQIEAIKTMKETTL